MYTAARSWPRILQGSDLVLRLQTSNYQIWN
jgi:hypothetical protein